MKNKLLGIFMVLAALTGCFSKSGGNSSALPEELKGKHFSVIQHTGSVTDWGITMEEFTEGFKKIVHPDSTTAWEADGKDSWVMRFKRHDKATNNNIELVLVFSIQANKAVVVRHISNGVEVTQFQLAMSINDIVYNVLQTLDKVDGSKRLPASE